MAEAGAHPGQQQHEAWGVDGPSVGERLEYLDLFADERVEVRAAGGNTDTLFHQENAFPIVLRPYSSPVQQQ